MKRVILLLIVIACLPISLSASHVMVPLDELVQDSDLIIVGTLNAVFEHSIKGIDYGEGTITIEEVIWGQATPGEPLLLKWQNRSIVVCPRVEHRHNANKSGVWLLTSDGGGVVRANYPGRLVDLSQRAKVERLLLEKKVCISSSKGSASASEPINMSVIFRNPSQSQIDFPGLEYKDGYLYSSPDIDFVIISGWGDTAKRISFLSSRLVVSSVLPPITVNPWQEHRTVVDLRQLLDVAVGESYRLTVEIKGYGLSNAFTFYAKSPEQQKPLDMPEEEPAEPISQDGSRLKPTAQSIDSRQK